MIRKASKASIVLAALHMKRNQVRWDADEWAALAKLVWKKRARTPNDSLVQLVQAVQRNGEWPADRTRKITTLDQIKPLVPILRKLDLEMVDLVEREFPKLQATIDSLRHTPDRETILAQLSPEEIVRRFGAVVLDALTPAEIIRRFPPAQLLAGVPFQDVMAFVGQSIMETQAELARLVSMTAKAAGGPVAQCGANGTASRPGINRVALVGFQGHYVPTLMNHVGKRTELVALGKGAEMVPADCSAVVVWDDHTPGNTKTKLQHAYGAKVILHRGTFTDLIHRLDGMACFNPNRKAK